MYFLHHYVIDWDKVKTIDDIKRLLAALEITLDADIDPKRIESVKDLLRLEEKPKVFMGITHD